MMGPPKPETPAGTKSQSLGSCVTKDGGILPKPSEMVILAISRLVKCLGCVVYGLLGDCEGRTWTERICVLLGRGAGGKSEGNSGL